MLPVIDAADNVVEPADIVPAVVNDPALADPDITADASVLAPADIVPAVLNDPALDDPEIVLDTADNAPDPLSSMLCAVATAPAPLTANIVLCPSNDNPNDDNAGVPLLNT